MFRWYRGSEVCYAYFSDVELGTDEDRPELPNRLANARWFTRGWTLQELLAPSEMVLYARDWRRIGTRFEFRDTLRQITGIETKYLCREEPVKRASVSKRMSWASKRNTSRVEDTAYCLLGIFDINIPLLYGDGKKAFRRLQEEILKTNPTDHTLLAWGTIVSRPKAFVDDPMQIQGFEPIPWDPDEAGRPLKGLFAESPRDFQGSGDIAPWDGADGFYTPAIRGSHAPVNYPSVIGAGVSLELPVPPSIFPRSAVTRYWLHPPVAQIRGCRFAILLCKLQHPVPRFIILPLYFCGFGRLGRTNELMLDKEDYRLSDCIRMAEWMQVEPQILRDPQPGDFLLRCWGNLTWYTQRAWDHRVLAMAGEGIFAAPLTAFSPALWALFYRLNLGPKFGFALMFGRDRPVGTSLGPVTVSLTPVLIDEPETKDTLTAWGFTWTPKSRLIHQNGSLGSLSPFQYSMTLPEDTWRVDVAPLPLIQVRVERMRCGQHEADLFDMVDITITDRAVGRDGIPKDSVRSQGKRFAFRRPTRYPST